MSEAVATQCRIAKGGPAGVILGVLLARAGVCVIVLEKHADFFRDFRSDVVHSSTLELMSEIRFLEAFLKVLHQEAKTFGARVGADRVQVADFRHLPSHCKFIALMPQWNFLNFLAARSRRYPGFDLRVSAEAVDIVEEGGRIGGVSATTPERPLTVRADPVVTCDGRNSTLRDKCGLRGDGLDPPMDLSPFLDQRFEEWRDWGDVKLLSARVGRRRWWRPGFPAIGKLLIQNQFINQILKRQEPPKAPALFELFNIFPILRRLPARLVGRGVRPEPIHTPELAP